MVEVKILGAKVHCLGMVETLCVISDFVNSGTFHHVITLNAEILYNAQDNQEMMNIINRADLVTPDGSGIVWAANKIGGLEVNRVTGIDLMVEICKNSKRNNWNLYLLGAGPGVAEKASENIVNDYEAQVVGYHDGYFQAENENALIEEINNSGADILFVALGAPKQEEWINRHRDELKPSVVIGVGGSFDVVSGNIERAPEFFQKLGIEWMWRLIKQPSRIGRMMALPKFVLLVNKTYNAEKKAIEKAEKAKRKAEHEDAKKKLPK